MKRPVLRVATRRSPLALAQAGQVALQLATGLGRVAELIEVTTVGDTDKSALATIGGTGVFVGAVRDAIRTGQADIGIHSLKDLPTQQSTDLTIAAVPLREDPRDALCATDGRALADLPSGSIVGTGSPRRAGQLKALRPDLDIRELRGNIDTRLGRVRSGDLDAVILAAAGLTRLGRDDAITETISTADMLPAPGQGALAVEARTDIAQLDPELHQALLDLDDAPTRAAVEAERAVLNRLESGCSAPVGALATLSPSQNDELTLQALVATLDGSQVIRLSISGSANDAVELGQQLADQLLANGASGLLGENNT